MKKILLTLFIISLCMITGLKVFADDKTDAINFFKNYANAANNYSPTIVDMYSPDAKIIRQVVKPNGELVNATTNMKTYVNQMKIGQATAKVRKYKNYYSNITAEKVPQGYKVSALRQPTGENYKLKTYQILKKQPDGSFKIVEELMQTKEQIFLKYADKK